MPFQSTELYSEFQIKWCSFTVARFRLHIVYKCLLQPASCGKKKINCDFYAPVFRYFSQFFCFKHIKERCYVYNDMIVIQKNNY